MPLLFALTMFVSATLLFLVQPMIGKMVLPLLGGTPAVWNTCMVFYQALLLGGYFYAHRSTTFLQAQQTSLHAYIMLGALGVLVLGAIATANHSPIPVVKSLSPQGDDFPFFGVIVLLMAAIGLPFFVVSTSAPLLQKWFAETGHPSSKDPYFLYAASNFGSLLALVAYPAIIEPNLLIIHQAWVWAIGYGILVALVFVCAKAVNKGPMAAYAPTAKNVKVTPIVSAAGPSLLRKLRWMTLAFVPSSLMLGVTTFVTTDMASIPLLWIIPLSLYLITFIIVFAKVPSGVQMTMSLLMPVMVLLIVFLMTSHVDAKFGLKVLLHMITFFVVAMVCHGELARDRPTAKHLTTFYLLMSVGGMLGGLFNALVAPIIFTFTSEYPITLVAACFMLPSLFEENAKKPNGWTSIIDLIAPAAIFFLCCILQTNDEAIGTYVYANGTLIIAGGTLFLLCAGPEIAFVNTSNRFRISVALLMGLSLTAFAITGPLMRHWQAISGDNVFLQAVRLLDPNVWRFLAIVPVVAGYTWYCQQYSHPHARRLDILLGLGMLAVNFLVLFVAAEPLAKNVVQDMAFKEKLSEKTVLQILIFGVPAMLCYFFVERPLRFALPLRPVVGHVLHRI